MAYLVKAVGYLSAGQWFETHAGQLFWIFLCVYFLIFFSSLEMISKKTVLYLWKAKMEKKIGHVKNRTYDLWLWYPMLYHWANQVQHITIVQASFISLGCEVRGSIFSWFWSEFHHEILDWHFLRCFQAILIIFKK